MYERKGQGIAMKNNGFCLKSESVTIAPSNMEDLWESDWIIAFRNGEK